MQAIHQACTRGALNASIAMVISNRPQAAGLDYAKENRIPTCVVDHHDFTDRVTFDRALADVIDSVENPLIILAGFMRRLTAEFTHRYTARMLNIHPSLLPRHPGLNTHASAIASGDRWHGCSVHYVTEELDSGPVIARAIVPLLRSDTPDALADRVISREHVIYPAIIQLCLRGLIEWQDGHILYCGKRLRNPLLF